MFYIGKQVNTYYLCILEEMCLFKWAFCAKVAKQISHLKGLFPSCVFAICVVRFDFFEKLLLQIWHIWGILSSFLKYWLSKIVSEKDVDGKGELFLCFLLLVGKFEWCKSVEVSVVCSGSVSNLAKNWGKIIITLAIERKKFLKFSWISK